MKTAAEGETKSLPSGSEKVLLVEDQPELRLVAGRMLRESGYEVFEAVDGQAALELVERDRPHVDLILTDVIMPRMNGRELADAVQTLLPLAKVCFMSGYSDDAIVNLGIQERSVHFVHKPFTGETLLQKIREVLDE